MHNRRWELAGITFRGPSGFSMWRFRIAAARTRDRSPSFVSTVASTVSASLHAYSPLVLGSVLPRSSLVRCALRQELVAHTVHSLKMNWPTCISFKLLTESQNVVVDGASAGIVFVTPNLVEQFISRNNAPRVLRQVFQSLEFQARELYWLTFAACLHGREAHIHITEH